MDASIAGGKGASLGEMTRAGIPVPPGCVVLSSAFEQFLRETDLTVEIDNLLHEVDPQAVHTVERASEQIQTLILNATMPEDIANEIKTEFATLGAEFVAVRSSATAEDSASAAWAGQLDSFLNTTQETLLHNVQKCWASLFTPRAIFYRFEKKPSHPTNLGGGRDPEDDSVRSIRYRVFRPSGDGRPEPAYHRSRLWPGRSHRFRSDHTGFLRCGKRAATDSRYEHRHPGTRHFPDFSLLTITPHPNEYVGELPSTRGAGNAN